jgi:hypothetical protein
MDYKKEDDGGRRCAQKNVTAWQALQRTNHGEFVDLLSLRWMLRRVTFFRVCVRFF